MFDTFIDDVKGICETVDSKICARLSVEQFGNLMCILSDKGLIDGSETSKEVKEMIVNSHRQLMALFEAKDFSRKTIRSYQKDNNRLLLAIKKAYDLEPVGSIQNHFMAIGVALGTGIGASLSAVNPAMISIGIGLGIVTGMSIGKKKEKEAKEAGKLF